MDVKSMARLPRMNLPGVAQHIIQRGNNRQICFSSSQDYLVYRDWLMEYAGKHEMAIHAYVLMTNHVHILATPKHEVSIPKTMQSLGRKYVRYFNHVYRRSGTLWEGRYKSSLVQNENYLMECYRYIELNPVRAGMVDDPANYRWSSYRSNALSQQEKGLTWHPEYRSLGTTNDQRCEAYMALFTAHIDGVMIKDIRGAVNKGLVLGSERFKDEIERNLNRRVRPAKMGRPKKVAGSEVGRKSLL
jgi:putative transposase